jgi:hypothetical protein
MNVINTLKENQAAKLTKLVTLMDELNIDIQPDNFAGLAFLDDNETIDFFDLRQLLECYNLSKTTGNS